MSVYIHDTGYHSRRAMAFVAIVVVHIFAIYAFATGLAKRAVQFVTAPLQTDIIQVEKPKDLPPPPPPVDLKERPPVQVVVPDINISVPVETPPPITTVTTQPVAAPRPPPAPVVDTKFSVTYKPDVNEFYPDVSRRNGEEGRALVKVCVEASGKIANADLGTSSGFPRLDEAAVRVVKAMRFKPPTQGGKPVDACTSVPIRFELHEAK
jgi:protein TonB